MFNIKSDHPCSVREGIFFFKMVALVVEKGEQSLGQT